MSLSAPIETQASAGPSSLVLTSAEHRVCEWVGKQRHANALAGGRDPGAGPSSDPDSGAEFHVRGARCEFACSVLLNLYWRPTVGLVRERDVGGLVQVRSTIKTDGRLIVKPADEDVAPFALIVEHGGTWRFAGWRFAYEAKREPLLTQFGDPAHFVSQHALAPIEALLEWLKGVTR